MTLDAFLQSMRPVIEEELKRAIQRPIFERNPELRSMLAYHMGWEGEGAGPDAQGKRIRPMMVLLCAAAAGAEWRAALPAATAVELLHNFSLVHDDIQDHSELRRARPTLWVRWGTAQAINSGDVLFTLAHLSLLDLAQTVSLKAGMKASQALHQACLSLTEGQFLDLSYESARSEIGVEEYWPMVGGKTAALLGCCTELGAIAAQASDQVCRDFWQYGYSLGLAFQALDDWLGIWGDAALTGKSTDSDLVSGKKTLPVVFALAQNGAFARRWREGAIRAEEVPQLADLLRSEAADEYTLQMAEKLTAESMAALERGLQKRAAIPGQDAGQALRELSAALLHRKK